MFDLLDKLKLATSGYKTYIMLGFGIMTVVLQFLGGFDLGVPALPPVETIGEVVQQLYGFVVAGTFRAALTK